MDEFDFERAAQFELQMRELAITAARIKQREAHIRPEEFDGSCLDCGGEIPELRLAAGYYRCVDCVRAKELRERLHL